MSEQMLTLLKFGLLGLLYVFFVVALKAVWSEVRRPAAPAAELVPSGPPASLGKPNAPAGPAAGTPAAPALASKNPAAEVALSDAPAKAAPKATKPHAALQIVAPESMAGRSYPLDREITVGRAAGCGICIDDTFVSTIHARVYAADPYWMVEDLGSTNGTLFNGAKLEAPQVIRPGDQIQLGSTILELQ